MPRKMLNDQHWSKLQSILRNLSIHHNSNLRNFIIDGTMYDIKIAPELILGLDLKETQVVCVDKGANSNMRCDSLKSLMIINKLSKFL